MKPDLEALAGIRFIACELLPTTTAVDDGARVYVADPLPEYLLKREIIEGDALNTLTIQQEKDVVCRLLIPCAFNCRTLADPIRPGCRVLHIAAHNPGLTIAELAALKDVHIELADHIFYNQLPEPVIYLYSDKSVLLRRFPNDDSPDAAYRTIVDFVRRHYLDMAGSDADSAMGRFRLFCAQQHIDEYFQGFLPV